MNRCHKLPSFLALGLFALLPAVGSAAEEIKKPATIEEVLSELKLLRQANEASINQVKLFREDLASLRLRVDALERNVDTMLKTQVRTSFASPVVGTLTDELKRPAILEDVLLELKLLRQANEASINQVKQFRDEVASLRLRVDALEQKIDSALKTQVRTSFAPPQTGTIRLENRLGVAATIFINDVAYRLQPFRTLELPTQPAGTFTYEVLAEGFGMLQPRVTRTLQPNQVYTIFTFQP